MKLAVFSNYLSIHQTAFAECMAKKVGWDFVFVSTKPFNADRKALGYEDLNNKYEYVFNGFDSDINKEKSIEIIKNTDLVIFGSAPRELLDLRLKTGRPTFFYAERIYKNGYNFLKWPIRLIRFWKRYARHKNLYLLSASAYTATDYAKHLTFINKAYKWGYFPETKYYDIEELLEKKSKNKILWCGRFLDWKHPDDAIKIALKLKKNNYDFELDFIGTGEIEKEMGEEIKQKGLENCVHMLGSMKPEEVRQHMENAGIYLFTSDFQEGWGAVLNEAMNSGCAVVANHAIGAVPFLIKHKRNGFIYKNGDIEDLYNKVKYLLDNPDEQVRLGNNAYHTVTDLWNAEIASERFLKFAEEIKDHGYCDLYEEGPCSRAQIIKNDWFKE